MAPRVEFNGKEKARIIIGFQPIRGSGLGESFEDYPNDAGTQYSKITVRFMDAGESSPADATVGINYYKQAEGQGELKVRTRLIPLSRITEIGVEEKEGSA